MTDFVTKRKFQLEFQQDPQADEWNHPWRVNLIEGSIDSIKGINSDYADSERGAIYLIPSLIKSYIDGTGPYVQKADETLFRDHGNVILKYPIQEVLDKYKEYGGSKEESWYKEYHQLCIDWVKIFYTPLEEEVTLEKYIKYLRDIPESKLLAWGKKMVGNYHQMSKDTNEYYSSLSQEEKEQSLREFIRDWLFSNEGWALGFFEDDIFQEPYIPDDFGLNVIEDSVDKCTVKRVDALIKEHEDEIIAEIFETKGE